MKFETAAIHVGQDPDPTTGAVIPPISLSTTFAQSSPGKPTKFDYSRSNNPTRQAFERCVAACEGGKDSAAFSSGLAATVTLLHLLEAGDHIVCIDDVYGGTQRYFRRVASNFHLEFSFVDFEDMQKVKAALRKNTKLIWIESPTNPTMKIVDIRQIASIANNHGAILVVDNTFMSPYFQRPLELGAHLSLNSVSKYINGHSDVIMGVVSWNDDSLGQRIRFLQNSLGGVPSPFDCYLANRGLKTLAIRMRKHEANAMKIAATLEKHPKVKKVLYPGLKSHPQHEIAKSQQHGFGGMITFFLDSDLAGAERFLKQCKYFTLAESLGGVESLIEHPALMTHASVPPQVRQQLGIDDTLIRISVGIEDIDDLLEDLNDALAAV
ncbi:hypothetical protein GAYE_SCF37G5164 [Galdieria yellowstonensis]|uniref:cystathionine gamma-lyase n=1 Tax=Galdieria yellowstonensis TaxID=3028027 RepID=A0AAV9III2_9RHOD|nr:hypothetical protein GAYE_SCF37G5164 [Galdieria yellowstonensis]